jgi:hypothetical protein
MNRQYFQDRSAVNSRHASNVTLCGLHNLFRTLRTILIVCFRLFTARYLLRQGVEVNSIELLLPGIKNLYMILPGRKSMVMFVIRVTLQLYVHSGFKFYILVYLDATKLPYWCRYLLDFLNLNNTGKVHTR